MPAASRCDPLSIGQTQFSHVTGDRVTADACGELEWESGGTAAVAATLDQHPCCREGLLEVDTVFAQLERDGARPQTPTELREALLPEEACAVQRLLPGAAPAGGGCGRAPAPSQCWHRALNRSGDVIGIS
eukprot:gene24500-16996_t